MLDNSVLFHFLEQDAMMNQMRGCRLLARLAINGIWSGVPTYVPTHRTGVFTLFIFLSLSLTIVASHQVADALYRLGNNFKSHKTFDVRCGCGTLPPRTRMPYQAWRVPVQWLPRLFRPRPPVSADSGSEGEK